MSDWNVEKPKIAKKTSFKIKDLIGDNLEEAFLEFDLTEVQKVVKKLQSEDVPTLAQAERLQQEALRAADVLSEHLAKIHKTIHYLTAKVSSVKNKECLNYEPPSGTRMSNELRKMAGESSDKVLELELTLAKAKGAKTAIEKKYDIVIKTHHHYKDIANGLRKTIQGYSSPIIMEEEEEES